MGGLESLMFLTRLAASHFTASTQVSTIEFLQNPDTRYGCVAGLLTDKAVLCEGADVWALNFVCFIAMIPFVCRHQYIRFFVSSRLIHTNQHPCSCHLSFSDKQPVAVIQPRFHYLKRCQYLAGTCGHTGVRSTGDSCRVHVLIERAWHI